jgi:uncharacterized metal-binding protein YceD (DUF177 family)
VEVLSGKYWNFVKEEELQTKNNPFEALKKK